MRGLEIEQRFWEKVDWDLNDIDRCWPWLASKMRRGYGQFSFKGSDGGKYVVRAHRLAYELEFGSIPESNDDGEPIHVDHRCHDPKTCNAGDSCPHRACCNPFHMKLSTNKENHLPGRVDGRAGGIAADARMTREQRLERSRRSLAIRWNNPEARRISAEKKRQWWASLLPEERQQLTAKIGKAKSAYWASADMDEREKFSEKVRVGRRRQMEGDNP